METIISVLVIIGFIVLGFLIAEFQNAHLGKEVKDGSKLYFTLIGVEFTQRDFQRLIFAILLGMGTMQLLPLVKDMIPPELNLNIIYMIIGYSPSTIMVLIKKKIQKK
jgi:hypothetical protein